MVGSSFDTLARLVAAHASRRSLLRSSLAMALAGFGAASLFSGEDAAAKKRRKKKKRCRNWILSSGPDPTAEIEVDDDLTVFRNGQEVFKDDDGESSDHAPIYFTARKGAKLKIVAFDVQADCHELSPLYLQCKEKGGSPRKLSDGVPRECPNVAVGEFFNETFTI